MATATPTRRTQAERSATTTRRLLDATMQSLAERGYRGTTTSEVARRAGVSRGAMLHHYPNRNALLTAAAEWTIEARIEEFRIAMAAVADASDRIRAAVDLLWEICSSPTYTAWIELALAARTEPELADVVAELDAKIRIRIRETWTETFPELQDNELAATVPDFALSLLEGLALRQLLSTDAEVATAVVEALKNVGTLVLAGPPPELPR